MKRTALLLLLVSCGVQQTEPNRTGRAVVEKNAGSPERFGFGRPATPEEIARIDIDVRPDGLGLPIGSGTAAQGAEIFAARCAGCHGVNGEGVRGVGSRVIGAPRSNFDFALSRENESQKAIGNYWPYASTVFDYVRRAMPFDAPGSLSDNEVYAVTAFLLARNGVIAENVVLNATSLPQVRMPARNHFVPDDRLTSKRVK